MRGLSTNRLGARRARSARQSGAVGSSAGAFLVHGAQGFGWQRGSRARGEGERRARAPPLSETLWSVSSDFGSARGRSFFPGLLTVTLTRTGARTSTVTRTRASSSPAHRLLLLRKRG